MKQSEDEIYYSMIENKMYLYAHASYFVYVLIIMICTVIGFLLEDPAASVWMPVIVIASFGIILIPTIKKVIKEFNRHNNFKKIYRIIDAEDETIDYCTKILTIDDVNEWIAYKIDIGTEEEIKDWMKRVREKILGIIVGMIMITSSLLSIMTDLPPMRIVLVGVIGYCLAYLATQIYIYQYSDGTLDEFEDEYAEDEYVDEYLQEEMEINSKEYAVNNLE